MLIDCHVHCGLGQFRGLRPPVIDDLAVETMKQLVQIYQNKGVQAIRDGGDSSGIGIIMGRYKTVSLIGGEVWAVHTNERIRKILTFSGAAKIMQIYEGEK